MTAWTPDELSKIGKAEELQIASLRRNGTQRTPVTIWVVPHDGGRIRAGGVDKDVTFVNADRDIDEAIDAAYRAKYRRYAGRILNSVLTPQARSTTTRLEPRSTRS